MADKLDELIGAVAKALPQLEIDVEDHDPVFPHVTFVLRDYFNDAEMHTHIECFWQDDHKQWYIYSYNPDSGDETGNWIADTISEAVNGVRWAIPTARRKG